jgi:hypothetical protein
MKSRLIAVAIHKRVICGNDRFAPTAAVQQLISFSVLPYQFGN